MVRMIVTDLDGTLLRDDKNISDFTLSILEKCRARGIKLAIATARAEGSAKRCIDLVKPDLMILNGGALVIDNRKNVIFERLLSVETADGIVNELINNKNAGAITVETERDYYVSYGGPAYHADYMYGKQYDFSKPLSERAYKITAEIFDRDAALSIEKKFGECRLTSFSGENWHRFAHREAEKMRAIAEISGKTGIEISGIAAFGDDYNDIDMVKNCGIGIAMENGIREIKDAAKYVCGNNNEDGVGKWIEKNILHCG
jgi:Cof subfamily protein (haloacid dehalogenase superfamily)